MRKVVFPILISEVSKRFGLTHDTLRYYERVGLILPVPRSANGIRNYTDHICRWIGFVHGMRNAGVSIEVLKEYVTLYAQGEPTRAKRKALLQNELVKIQKHIDELQAFKDKLTYKVAHYDTIEEKFGLDD